MPDAERLAQVTERPPPRPPRAAVQAPAGLAAVASGLGNARFGRLVAPARPTLSRFVGSEHAELGNTTGTAIDLGNGVVLTWGEIVALAGDEYGSPEELLEDTKTPEGKARLRAALEHDGIPGAIAGTLPAPTKEQRAAHEAKFIRLAMDNVAPFPDGGAAISAWSRHHAAAIELAVQAGLANDPAGIILPYLHEAFGEHFLTDCFSGGHVRTPRKQILEFYVGTFGPRVAQP